ncbi:MAG: beta strand repeat-containing protein, partial [Bacteroidales bacterium]
MIKIISIYKKRFQAMFFIVGLLFLLILGVDNVNAATRTASVSGNWSATATWGGSAVPVAGDVIIINSGVIVTVNINTAAVASITINAPSANNGITISGTNTLTVTGAITMNTPSTGVITSTIDVGTGTLSAASIAIPGSSTASRFCTLSVSTGTISISGNITFSGTAAQARIIFNGSGVLNVGGTFGTGGTFTASTGTVNCNLSGDQSVAPYIFNNLTLSGSGVKTFATTPTVNGILSMEGTATIVVTTGVVTYGANATLKYNTASNRTVTSEEWITTFDATGGVIINNTGTITLNEAKIFNSTAPLTISNGASLSMSNFLLTLNGNFINSGTASGTTGGVTIAGTATQNIGAFTTTGTVSLTKTGGTATLQGNINGALLTINGSGGTLSLGTGLTHTFTGTWTRTAGALNGGSSLLKIGGSVSGSGGTFTAGTGTVEWNASGSQSIAAVAYNNLILSGSGAKSIITGTSIAGNLSISGATASINTGINITANTLTLGGFNKINGTWGSTTSSATYKDNTYFAATTGLVTVTTDTRSTPSFSSLTASQSICYGTSTVTLIGAVSAIGPMYPANGETIGITINGNTQSTTISDGVGGFSINFNTAAIPASVTPYIITYTYSGNTSLKAAPNNTDNTLTVNLMTGISSQSTGTQTQCIGGAFTSISVTATGVGLSYQWYSNISASTSGGTSLGSSNGAQTNTYTPQASVVGTLFYYCIVTGTCSTATSSISGAFLVNPLTAIINQSTGAQTQCFGGSFTPISVTSTGVGLSYQWYRNSSASTSGGTSLGSINGAQTNTYTPQASAAGTSYYYCIVTGTCNTVTSLISGVFQVNSAIITGTAPGSRCGAGTVSLSASTSVGTINWYATSSGGSSLGTGSLFTTPSISSNTTYYVDVNNSGCVSSLRTPVIAYIVPLTSIVADGGGTYCGDSNITLTSTGTNTNNQYWAGPNSFYSISQNPVLGNITPTMSGTYTVTGSALSGINLVTNGDFESGNTAFTSSYTLALPTSDGLYPEGTYDVIINPQSRHSNFATCVDHTSGSGMQMVVNGSTVPAGIVWSQTVNVVPATDYQFTYWEQSVVGSNPSQLQLYANGSPFGVTYTVTSTTCLWQKFIYNWNSGSSTTAVLSLVNQNTIASGNDFALDDIFFEQVCAASDTVNVTVNTVVTAGSIGTSQTICSGATPASFTSITPGTGSGSVSYEWQTNASGSYITISGATAATYSPPALTSTTSYKRRTLSISGGITCYSLYTTPITITFSAHFALAGGSNTVCQSAIPSSITLSGASFGGGASTAAWSIISGGGTLSSTAQTATPASVTYTPAVNYSGIVVLRLTTNVVGGCAAISDRTITVISTPIAPTLGTAIPVSGTTICAGYNTGTVTGTGGSGGSNGAANEYQYSINGGSTYLAYTNGSAIITNGATNSIIVQARRTDGVVCSNSAWSTICTWPVSSAPVSPTLSTSTPANGTTICAGFNTGTVTGAGGTGGSTGAANEYQYSINGG